MRNIDAKIEGIGFLIAKNEGELENLRIPIGGIVKLQDSGKMLERTASGYVEYSGGGGGGGLTTMSIAVKNTDEMKSLDVPDGTIVTVRDVWASEIIDNYNGGTENMYRISKGFKFINGDFSDTDALIMIIVGGSAEYNVISVQSSGGSVTAGFYLMSDDTIPIEVHQYDDGIIDNEFLAKMNDAMKNILMVEGGIPYNKMDFLIDTMNMQFIKSNKGWLKLGASEYLTDRHYELVNPCSPARCKFYDKWYECTEGADYNEDLTLETSPFIMRHNDVIGGNDMIDTVLEKLDGSVTLTYDNENIQSINGVEFGSEDFFKLNINLEGLYYLKRGTIRFNLYPVKREKYAFFVNSNCMLDDQGTSQLTTNIVDGEFIHYSPIIVRASGGSNFILPDGIPANLYHQSLEYYAIVIDSTDGCYLAWHNSNGTFNKVFEFTKKQ